MSMHAPAPVVAHTRKVCGLGWADGLTWPCRSGFELTRIVQPANTFVITWPTAYVGYAARDTVPCGIPCRAGYRYVTERERELL